MYLDLLNAMGYHRALKLHIEQAGDETLYFLPWAQSFPLLFREGRPQQAELAKRMEVIKIRLCMWF